MADLLFTAQFVEHLRFLIQQHHILYSAVPPFGILFESLVARAFRATELSPVDVVRTTPNVPREDLQLPGGKISIKTETGVGTHPALISITKLCTTERDPWEPEPLVQRVLEHLAQYDRMLMLRAIWPSATQIHYQLLDVPIGLLRRVSEATLAEVGRRASRRSLGGSVFDGDVRVFRVHFDGTDGKCQIHGLRVDRCVMLREWEHYVSD